MVTDLLLDDNGGEWITLSAAVLSTNASDVMIDNPDRRMPEGPEFRRALVHDETDGLSVNFADDYPGGLTLTGVVKIIAKEVVTGDPPDLTLPPKKIPWNLWGGLGSLGGEQTTILTDVTVHPAPRFTPIPSLKIEGGIEFTWNHGGLRASGGPAQEQVNLQSVLEDLRAQIIDLQMRLEALGG